MRVAQLRVCSSRALSRLRDLFRVGAWCSDPGTHVLSLGFVTGFGHSRSMFCLVVWSRVCLAVHSSVHVFCVACSSCFIGCVLLCYVLCCVAPSLCFSLAACFYVVISCMNMWLMGIPISGMFVSCFAHGW